MEWTTPTMNTIKMDAEIGSYQEDGEREPVELLSCVPLRRERRRVAARAIVGIFRARPELLEHAPGV
jgi:hypothetical protein